MTWRTTAEAVVELNGRADLVRALRSRGTH